ncbi:MAG: hypothetical protein ABIZ70_14305 [Gemmatimonadales bacterium]
MTPRYDELPPLKPGEGMGDFMRFTTDAPDSSLAELGDGFTCHPEIEPASRRLSRIGIFRRLNDQNVLRLL